jgi:hypothetical protein
VLLQVEMRGLDSRRYRDHAMELLRSVGLQGFEAPHKLFPNTNKGAKDLTKKQWLDSAELPCTRKPHKARRRA